MLLLVVHIKMVITVIGMRLASTLVVVVLLQRAKLVVGEADLLLVLFLVTVVVVVVAVTVVELVATSLLFGPLFLDEMLHEARYPIFLFLCERVMIHTFVNNCGQNSVTS